MLVSIIVITYNSSRFVLETLESALQQTYPDIELIVSDDCSTDDTYNICQEWVNSHKERFVRAVCTQTHNNKGICGNYNHALKFAQGDWIKYIAGDDILKSNCIERYIANIKTDVFIYTCITEHLDQNTGEIKKFCTHLPNKSANRQVRLMLRFLYAVEGSSLFFEKKHLILIGGFDIQYPMIEDWPIVMKYLTHKLRIEIINEPLIVWRVDTNSVCHASPSHHISFSISINKAIHYYTFHYCWRYGLLTHQYYYWLKDWINKKHNDGYGYIALGYFMRCFDLVYQYRKINAISILCSVGYLDKLP
jgi:alpha-1,3-rhamnosyltransferase